MFAAFSICLALSGNVAEAANDINKQNQEIIKKYYSSIGSKEAYQMKVKSSMTLESFQKMYKDQIAQIDSIKNIGKNRYELKVRVINQVTAKRELYKVRLEIVNNKIKTISSNLVHYDKSQLIVAGNKKAYVEWKDGSQFLILENQGKRIAIEKFVLNPRKIGIGDPYFDLKNLKFSSKGSFIQYTSVGWGGIEKLYDIKKNKIVYSTTADIFITKDEKYFVACAEDGMTEGEVKVFALKNFNKVRDLEQGNGITECKLNKNKLVIDFRLHQKGQSVVTNWQYDIYKDKLVQK